MLPSRFSVFKSLHSRRRLCRTGGRRSVRARWCLERLEDRVVLTSATAVELPLQLPESLAEGEVFFLAPLSSTDSFRINESYNIRAADTTNTEELWPGGALGLDLTGAGLTVGVWEANNGWISDTHQELVGRVVYGDSDGSVSGHSTHVAGTIAASGVDSSARGMASEVLLRSYTANNANFEMDRDADLIVASNHSYGIGAGWSVLDTASYPSFPDVGKADVWWGDRSQFPIEDPGFSQYDSNARDLDVVLYNNPNLLSVWAAGNQRGEKFTNELGDDTYVTRLTVDPGGVGWTGAGWYLVPNSGDTSAPPADGNGGTGFDSLSPNQAAKNQLVVGAANDITGDPISGSQVSLMSFSAWGPTDDGRIKPDLVANGQSVRSASSSADDAYNSRSGTSMAAPNVTGTSVLLIEHYNNLFGVMPRAATTKGLMLHTALDAGNTGPDYSNGWGLLDAAAAANLLTEAASFYPEDLVIEDRYASDPWALEVVSDGSEPIKATISWTDPAGSLSSEALDDPTLRLVNDLDLWITDADGNTFYPWTLDPANPADPAVRTEANRRDNVEQVLIDLPEAGTYFINVGRSGDAFEQDFSLIVSGAPKPPTPGEIRGTVFDDQDGDAARGAEEPGLANQAIFLDANANDQFDEGEPATLTDTNGQYAFTGLGIEPFAVTMLTRSGWQQTSPLPPDASQLVDLGPSEIATGIDFGVRAIGPVGEIQGALWNDADGSAIRDAGELPLEDWTVFLDFDGDAALDPTEPREQTGADGAFQFVGWAEGDYTVAEVVKAGWQQTFPEINSSGNQSQEVTLTAGGQALGIDFGNFQLAPGEIRGTIWNDIDGDGVRDPVEPGIADGTLFLDLNENGTPDEDEPVALTDQTGAFAFTSVPPTTYTVAQVRGPNYRPTFPGTSAAEAVQLVTVSPGEIAEGVDFGSQRFGTGLIEGVKWNDLNGDGVLDEDEPLLEGWTIFLDDNGDGLYDDGERVTTTAADGSYRFSQLPVGRFTVAEMMQPLWEQTSPQSPSSDLLVTGEGPVRVLVPTDDSLGLDWTGGSEPFDDSQWIEGTGGVGYDTASTYDSLIGVDVQFQMQNVNPVVYTRIPLTVDRAAAIDRLTLRMRYDDGFVAFLNGVEIASGNAPVELGWNTPSGGRHDDSLAVVYQDFDVTQWIQTLQDGENILAIAGFNETTLSSDMLIQAELVAASNPPIVSQLTLFSEQDQVTALVPTDSSLGVSWTGGAEPFDDSAWLQSPVGGPSGVGYERSFFGISYRPFIGVNVVNQMFRSATSVYLRTTFDVQTPEAVTGLTLGLRYDDGFVAYLNGTRVASRDAPDSVSWNDRSTASRDDDLAVLLEPIDLSGALDLLREGENILAIHGLNQNANSSDMLIQPELAASVIELGSSDGVWLVNLDAGETVSGLDFGNRSTASQVTGRFVFYNNSQLDGNDVSAGVEDDAAIAPDPATASEPALGKTALLPGESATRANYTSFASGINGVMIDVDRLPRPVNLTADDFEFLIGRDGDVANWTAAPPPREIAVRLGTGTGGADRITVVWDDGAITNQWLQVTLKANANTALAADEIHYWGNAVGETGNSAGEAVVDFLDSLATAANQTEDGVVVGAENLFDFNRDAVVDTTDVTIAEDHFTRPTGDLNRDERVGLADVGRLQIGIGSPQAVSPEGGDLDGDGVIGRSDLRRMLGNFGSIATDEMLTERLELIQVPSVTPTEMAQAVEVTSPASVVDRAIVELHVKTIRRQPSANTARQIRRSVMAGAAIIDAAILDAPIPTVNTGAMAELRARRPKRGSSRPLDQPPSAIRIGRLQRAMILAWASANGPSVAD